MLVLLALDLSLVLSIRALGIFIPLDVEPGSGTCSRWSTVIASISANSETPFFSIVNPDDGPGEPGSQPSDAYRQCVPSLRPRSNATVLGHINTEMGSKSLQNVLAEIDTYAGWNSSYRPTGILFDGVPSNASLVGQYKSYATYARSKGFNFITLDPGEMPDSAYFGIADLVNIYEDSYSNFNADRNVVNSTSTPVSKQSIWLMEAPTTGSYGAVISQLVDKGVGAVYISELNDGEAGIPSQWTSFAADVGKTNVVPNGLVPSGTNVIPPQPSSTSGTNTETTEEPRPSNRPPVGAIVGGVLGALAVISVILSIVFVTRRNRRRRGYNVTEEIAHPFTSESSPSGNDRSGLFEKQRPLPEEPGGSGRELQHSRIGPSPGNNNLTNIQTTPQNTPASSAVIEKSDGQPGPAISNLGPGVPSTPGESPSIHRPSTVEPPPYYSP